MMRSEELKKIVYLDEEVTKVIRGYVVEEDEFTYTIKAERDNAIIIIGKRAVIKIAGERKK